jgi:hypothetical protein
MMQTIPNVEQTLCEVSHLIERYVAKAQNQHAQMPTIHVFSTGRLQSGAEQPGMEKSQGLFEF